MRITFVLPPLGMAGGMRVVAIYAKRLSELGHKVTCVAPGNHLRGRKIRLKEFLGLNTSGYENRRPSHFDQLFPDVKVLEKFRPVTNSDVPDGDVVVATWWQTAEWVSSLAKSKGAKAYFLQHYEAHDGLPRERVDATWRLPFHKIVIADWLAALSSNNFGDSDVSKVPNAVDTSSFFAEPSSKNEPIKLCTMGSNATWKGNSFAFDGFKTARATYPEISLTIFSASPLKSEIPEGATLVLNPTQDEISQIYAGSDAYIFSSTTEGFGLPILEAMACRTPVIGTAVGAAPEFIRDDAGILIDAGNSGAIADAILKMAALDNGAWQKMSETAYKRASSTSWERSADLFEKALYRAIEKSS